MNNADLAIIARELGWELLGPTKTTTGLPSWCRNGQALDYDPPYDTDGNLMLELMIKYKISIGNGEEGDNIIWFAWREHTFVDEDNYDAPPAAVAACALAIIKGEKDE